MELLSSDIKWVSSKRWAIFAFFCLGHVFVSAQQKGSFDMVVLKDRSGRTVKSFFAGIPIGFGTTSGKYVDGIIKKVERDSIFIQHYDIRRAMTMWGTQVQDTVSIYWTAYHPNEIAWLRKPAAKFEFVRNGMIFMIGGVGYALLHAINAAYLDQPVVWGTMGIAAGIAAGGYIMFKLRKKRYVVGRGYELRYIDTGPSGSRTSPIGNETDIE